MVRATLFIFRQSHEIHLMKILKNATVMLAR